MPKPEQRSRLRFDDAGPIEVGDPGRDLKKKKAQHLYESFQKDSEKYLPSERLRHDDGGYLTDRPTPVDSAAAPPETPAFGDAAYDTAPPTAEATPGNMDDSGALRQNVAKPEGGSGAGKRPTREAGGLYKSKLRVEETADKLDVARDRLSRQKPQKPPGVIKTFGTAAGHEVWARVHGKIHEIEGDNVGVEAAHSSSRTALSLASAGKRRLARSVARPLRHEPASLSFVPVTGTRHTTVAQGHPELNKSAASRYMQKRRLRKKYQKEAEKAAKKTAQKTAVTTEKIARAVFRFARRHPMGLTIALLCVLLVVVLQSCMSGALTIGGSLGGGVMASTFPSENADMLAAEAAYARMEADLQYELDNYAALHPGYDEYHYDLDDIEHDPYVLISIVTAWHEGAWTIDEVQGTLSMLFERQYILTETVTVETRYRTETTTTTDPVTGETSEESVEVAYNYYICTVTLENFNLSHLPVYIMGEDRLSRYALYMTTLGNRPDLFPVSLYPHASTIKPYMHYGIPPEYFGDEVFAAMIAEAEKYLGYPYVWGGSTPSTSFDCSGFVSWVINHSGWDVGRLGSDGLWAICTPIAPSEAKPGDLIFFEKTYDTPFTSHVGIYVGDGMMIHCGNPISYASINTTYWQQHFFGFARLP